MNKLYFFVLTHFFSLSLLAQSPLTKDYTCVVQQEKRYIGGIGIKLGDPMSLSMKAYFLERFGFELTAGLGMSGNFSSYMVQTLENDPQFEGFAYSTHDIDASYAAQARLMMHFPIPGGIPGLDAYLLAGYQMRYVELDYHYIFRPDPFTREADRADYTNIDQGPELGLGIEYAFSGLPLAAFAEISAMHKTNGIQKKLAPMGGIGFRVNIPAPELDKKPGYQKQMKARPKKRRK